MAMPVVKADPAMQSDSGSILNETIAAVDAILGPELDEMVSNGRLSGCFSPGSS